jgi:alpha,alpha-trehalase
MRKVSNYLFMLFIIISPNVFSQKSENTDLQIAQYIDKGWELLRRDNLLQPHIDPKLSSAEFIIYVPDNENIKELKKKKTNPHVQFAYLPKNHAEIKKHGLLYLPYPYVVPGGRFNEMYGWDSFFIVLGLLENNRFSLAKNMIDNFIYEINNYGMILNANRTYYLGRSQPPLLTEMILAYYDKVPDKNWLKHTLPAINKLHHFWTSAPHAIPQIGLSRYYAGGKGSTPEESPLYYEKVLNYFKNYSGKKYNTQLYYDKEKNQLTNLFYVADRTLRESGLDISAKYGPFGVEILDYAPVDLNTFLYKMEHDAQKINEILGNVEESIKWQKRAQIRANNINHYLWNERTGYYLDYNFKKKKQKYYPYATTFYPLWAGVASQKQAEAVKRHLQDLLLAGGIVTSTRNSGLQWDAPFGWAPMQYFAVLGLDRYGYKNQAREIADKFTNTVKSGFQKNHVIYEKYDVSEVNALTENKIKYSYATNEIGFGWTNGVYLILRNYLAQSKEASA